MGKIYVEQTALQFKGTLGIDITGASVTQIKYRKPGGTEGVWTAVVSVAATGVIYYNVADDTILDEAGVWTLWGYVTLASGKSAPGEPYNVHIYTEGE